MRPQSWLWCWLVLVLFRIFMGFESDFECVHNMHNKFPLLKIHFIFLCLHRHFYSSPCRLRKYLSTPPSLSRQKPRGFEFCPFMTGRIDVSMTTVALDNKGCWKGCRNSIASTPCRNSCHYYLWTPQTINSLITWRIISLCCTGSFVISSKPCLEFQSRCSNLHRTQCLR